MKYAAAVGMVVGAAIAWHTFVWAFERYRLVRCAFEVVLRLGLGAVGGALLAILLVVPVGLLFQFSDETMAVIFMWGALPLGVGNAVVDFVRRGWMPEPK